MKLHPPAVPSPLIRKLIDELEELRCPGDDSHAWVLICKEPMTIPTLASVTLYLNVRGEHVVAASAGAAIAVDVPITTAAETIPTINRERFIDDPSSSR